MSTSSAFLKWAMLSLPFLMVSCATGNPGSVQLSYDRPPSANCEELGQVIGHTSTIEGARENTLNDLKARASGISGNFVRVLAISAHGTSARGIAYRCQ